MLERSLKIIFVSFQPGNLVNKNHKEVSGRLSRAQGSQAYIWMQSILFLWQWLFFAAPGRHLRTKFRGCCADHGQIEDHAHAQRHALEWLLWLKNGS